MVSSLPNKIKLWSDHNAQYITKTNTFKLSYNRSEMELKRVRKKEEKGDQQRAMFMGGDWI
jgi:hypothetical protein